jgi:hypothetical protein
MEVNQKLKPVPFSWDSQNRAELGIEIKMGESGC